MKKVLFLAYYYSPSGGAGVQRTVKFVKYLPDFGYIPVAAAGTGGDILFPPDNELSQEVEHVKRYDIQLSKKETKFNKALKGRLGRWFRISMQAWMHAAFRTVNHAIEDEKPDLLFVTTSPFQAAKVGVWAAQKYNIPWVLDMRDPWALDPITQYSSKIHYQLELQAMKNACQHANAVVMNTPSAQQAAIKAFSEIPPAKFHCITNGWDRQDFQKCEPQDSPCKRPLTIVHTGLFHVEGAKRNSKFRLSRIFRYSISPINLLARSPYYLFAACKKLIQEKKIEPDAIRFIFAGDATPYDRQLAEDFGLQDVTEFRGYLNHSQSIQLLFEADVLFLPLHELQNGSDPLIVPGKTYEYLASKKPILACVPKGDAYNFVHQSGLGYMCSPSNIEQISKALLFFIEHRNKNTGIPIKPNNHFIEKFERCALTKKLAELFNEVLK